MLVGTYDWKKKRENRRQSPTYRTKPQLQRSRQSLNRLRKVATYLAKHQHIQQSPNYHVLNEHHNASQKLTIIFETEAIFDKATKC